MISNDNMDYVALHGSAVTQFGDETITSQRILLHSMAVLSPSMVMKRPRVSIIAWLLHRKSNILPSSIAVTDAPRESLVMHRHTQNCVCMHLR